MVTALFVDIIACWASGAGSESTGAVAVCGAALYSGLVPKAKPEAPEPNGNSLVLDIGEQARVERRDNGGIGPANDEAAGADGSAGASLSAGVDTDRRG